jgi:hypothetical protein
MGIITGHDLLPISASFGTGPNRSYWTIQEKSIGKRKKKQHIFIPSGIKGPVSGIEEQVYEIQNGIIIQ